MTLIVATVGLHGSASTWAFNVARELALAAGPPEDALSFYADRVEDIPPKAATHSRIVIKSHHGSPELDAWLSERAAHLVLSLRDPRDAAISMAQRFKAPLRDAVTWLRRDCERLDRLRARPHLMLRYETRFFDRPETVTAIAAHLSIAVTADAAEAIFETYRTEAVRAFAQTLGVLPAQRRQPFGDAFMDRVTHIHSPHIGDGRSGKWKQLPAEIRQAATATFRPFLAAFDYEE